MERWLIAFAIQPFFCVGEGWIWGLPDENAEVPDWIEKVPDDAAEVPVESLKVPDWREKVLDGDIHTLFGEWMLVNFRLVALATSHLIGV